jgi:hypothetical protein
MLVNLPKVVPPAGVPLRQIVPPPGVPLRPTVPPPGVPLRQIVPPPGASLRQIQFVFNWISSEDKLSNSDMILFYSNIIRCPN